MVGPIASSLSCSCTENGGLQEIRVEVIEMTKDTGGGLDDDGEAHDEAHWAIKGKVPGHKAG